MTKVVVKSIVMVTILLTVKTFLFIYKSQTCGTIELISFPRQVKVLVFSKGIQCIITFIVAVNN